MFGEGSDQRGGRGNILLSVGGNQSCVMEEGKKKGYDLNIEIRQGKVEYLKRAKVCSEESDKKGKYMNTKYMKLNR